MTVAYDCLLQQECYSLPVNPFCFNLPCAVISYQEYAVLAGIPAEFAKDLLLYDAYSIAGLRRQTLLLYNSQLPLCRRRFTMAHELGHLLLNHDRKYYEEDEADYFASVLLMPDALLMALNRRGFSLTDKAISNVFGVSLATARLKRDTLFVPSLPHPLDTKIETLFYSEICRLSPIEDIESTELYDDYLDGE